MSPRRFAAGALTAALFISIPACGNDEDGDGQVLDEETENVVDETGDAVDDAGGAIEDGVDELEQQVDEGAEEDGEY